MPQDPIVAIEIAWMEPVEAAARLRGLGHLVFLDSAMPHPVLGRTSYVAADPFGRWLVEDGGASWNGEALEEPPLASMARLLRDFAVEDRPGLPPLQGGAIGYFAYEFGRLLDAQPLAAMPQHGPVPDAAFGFYDVVCCFDHVDRRAWIVSTGHPERDPDRRADRARQRASAMQVRLAAHVETAPSRQPRIDRSAWRSTFTRESYGAAVERVIGAVLNGDLFQANIAQCFSADMPSGFDPWAFYRALRIRNPAPFAAYLEDGSRAIASSSPERFISLDAGHVETRPIKGTARRAADAGEDRRRRETLLASVKDRAENLMIVDLMRNDLSRLCVPHSVKTPVLCGLETYAGVHHLVSVVTGTLRPGRGATDVIAATFPGGSITGAPKIEAMRLIAEIEAQRRGLYCGSIAWFGFNGRLDSNIAIRTVTMQNGIAAFQAGGGITALSRPAEEYGETLDKAARIFEAFADQDGATA
nr:aminodeoxychorismate synthase component I [Lichenihabitans psoromatis]